MSLSDGCPGSREIRKPYPEDIVCSGCGTGAEIWSDEAETTCRQCGRSISRAPKPTCLSWCSMAEECVGREKFARLNRKGQK